MNPDTGKENQISFLTIGSHVDDLKLYMAIDNPGNLSQSWPSILEPKVLTTNKEFTSS